ncbi:hypothetical protein [Streptomyces hydrogenans]|uniref:hypothetical protein n=1 Tax=Streptomyces hydrogenans TaxID=1873719 RepID=UPI003800B447
MGFIRRNKQTSTPANTATGFTPEQRAGQQRLNDRLAAARRAPVEAREPKPHERRKGWFN